MQLVRQVSCFLDLQGRASILGSIAHLSRDFIHDTHFQAKGWDEMTLHDAKRTVELRLTTIAWTAWVYYSPQGLRAIGEGMDCLCEFAAHLKLCITLLVLTIFCVAGLAPIVFLHAILHHVLVQSSENLSRFLFFHRHCKFFKVCGPDHASELSGLKGFNSEFVLDSSPAIF